MNQFARMEVIRGVKRFRDCFRFDVHVQLDLKQHSTRIIDLLSDLYDVVTYK